MKCKQNKSLVNRRPCPVKTSETQVDQHDLPRTNVTFPSEYYSISIIIPLSSSIRICEIYENGVKTVFVCHRVYNQYTPFPINQLICPSHQICVSWSCYDLHYKMARISQEMSFIKNDFVKIYIFFCFLCLVFPLKQYFQDA